MQNYQNLEDIICSYLLIPVVIGSAVLIGLPGGTSVAEPDGTTALYTSLQQTSVMPPESPDHDAPHPTGSSSQPARATTAMPESAPAGSANVTQAAVPDAAKTMRSNHDSTAARWHVQIASLSSPEGAQQVLDLVREQGIPAVQQAVTINGKNRWRILVTGFRTYAEAESQAYLLRKQLGIRDYWIKREQERR